MHLTQWLPGTALAELLHTPRMLPYPSARKREHYQLPEELYVRVEQAYRPGNGCYYAKASDLLLQYLRESCIYGAEMPVGRHYMIDLIPVDGMYRVYLKYQQILGSRFLCTVEPAQVDAMFPEAEYVS